MIFAKECMIITLLSIVHIDSVSVEDFYTQNSDLYTHHMKAVSNTPSKRRDEFSCIPFKDSMFTQQRKTIHAKIYKH